MAVKKLSFVYRHHTLAISLIFHTAQGGWTSQLSGGGSRSLQQGIVMWFVVVTETFVAQRQGHDALSNHLFHLVANLFRWPAISDQACGPPSQPEFAIDFTQQNKPQSELTPPPLKFA